ncbi:unnamed protein product [Brachionus calyciflorus]|uniref:Uncharacterized protein n=1 Tax=Brachionus calyciflorus TaxID=104777 RepID=A0A813SAI7_9BILA|nr:unnamed protein product [Brachionus calyciflorus]
MKPYQTFDTYPVPPIIRLGTIKLLGCLRLESVNLCIDKLCHIEIDEIYVFYNKPKLISKLDAKITDKKIYILFKNTRVVLFDKIFFTYFPKNIDHLPKIPYNFIYDFQNFNVYLNHVDTRDLFSSLSIQRFIFACEEFSSIKSQDGNYHLKRQFNKITNKKPKKRIYLKNDIESIQLNDSNTKPVIKILTVNLVNLDVKILKNHFLLNLKKSKVNIYSGKIPQYFLKNNKNTYEVKNLDFIVECEIFEILKINLSLYNPIPFSKNLRFMSKLTQFKKSFVFLFKLKEFVVNLNKDNQILMSLISSNNKHSSIFELVNQVDKFLVFKQFLRSLELYNFLNDDPIFSTKFIYINYKFESTVPSIKINISEKSNINLSKLTAISKIFDLILFDNFFRDLKKFNYVLIATLAQIDFTFPFNSNYLKAKFKQLSFKIENKKKLTSIFIFENMKFFTNLNSFKFDDHLSVNCERLIVEMKSKLEDTKLQFMFSPIQIGIDNIFDNLNDRHRRNSESNISTESYESFLYTHVLDENQNSDNSNLSLKNSLFLSVIQFRYHSFKNQEVVYSKFYELILGDIFGSVNFRIFLKIVDLICGIYKYIDQELDLAIFFSKSELVYKTFRILTSLINVNIFNDYDFSKETNVFNIILSPLNYAKCNFHCEDNQSGSLCTLTDIAIRILSSSPKKSVTEHADLIETGIFYFKFLSDLKIERNIKNQDELLKFLKKCDNETKRLNFFWVQKECSCVGENQFYSDQKELMYSYERDFVFKPCIYWLNKTESVKYGFGQSILEPDEIVFFSYRKFFPEYDFYSLKISNGKKFTVLSNLESNSKYIKNKFEPLRISVYDQELNTFMNESIDNNSLEPNEIEELNFKSTNMTPAYFSNEFSIYIRYLPKVKKFSNIIYKPNEKSSTKGCFSEIMYAEDSINIPYSDLNVDFFSKTSAVFKRIRFNWLKNYKKSFKKSLAKKSINLKEMKNFKIDKNFTSISSFSLNSSDYDENISSSINTNQNNNKSPSIKESSESKVKNNKVSHQERRTKTNRNKSNFFIYKLNLNQILYGFKQNDGKISGKKLCVEEVYAQTVYLSEDYEYENSYKNFLFEKNASTTNQGLNGVKLISSDLEQIACISKAYFLVTRASLECLSNLVEFIHKCMRKRDVEKQQYAKQRDNILVFSENRINSMENNLTFDKHICLDQITIQVFNISGDYQVDYEDIDQNNSIEALTFRTTSISLLENRIKRYQLIVFERTQFDKILAENNQIFLFDTLENLIRNLSILLFDKIQTEISIFKSRILFSNLIIGKFNLPQLQIDFNCTRLIDIQFEIVDLKFQQTPVEISLVMDLIKFINNLIFFLKKFKITLNYKLSILIRNFFIKFKLNNYNDNDTDDIHINYLIYLSGSNFKYVHSNNSSSISSDLTTKSIFKCSSNFTIDFTQINLSNPQEKSLFRADFDLNKKILDASLSVQIQLNQSDSSFFTFYFIFPLILESEFKSSDSAFEWQTPGMMYYSSFSNQVYQVADLNRIKILVNNEDEKILFEIDKIRFIRSSLNFDLSDFASKILDNIHLDLTNLTPYTIDFNIKNLCFNYFSDGFQSKSWFLLKLFDLKMSYFFSFDTSLEEDLEISFRDSLNNVKNELEYIQNFKINNSILLNVTTSSSILSQFDMNKWLDFCCMENNESHSYNIKFISALPSFGFEINYETRISNNSYGNDEKLVQIYWNLQEILNEDIHNSEKRSGTKKHRNPYFFVLNQKNLELIEKKIFKKLAKSNASVVNKIENYYSHSKPKVNIRIKDMHGESINIENLNFFDSKNFVFIVKNSLLKNILIVYNIFSLFNKRNE